MGAAGVLGRFHETQNESIGHGPQWVAEKQRAHTMAATGRQRALSDSERELHPLLAPGLGREGHMRERCSCAHLLLFHARQTMMFIVLLARLLSLGRTM